MVIFGNVSFIYWAIRYENSAFWFLFIRVSSFGLLTLPPKMWNLTFCGSTYECFASICGPWSSVDNTETIRAVQFWFFIHQSQLVPLYLTWLIFRDLTVCYWEHFIPKITWSLAKNIHKQYGLYIRVFY